MDSFLRPLSIGFRRYRYRSRFFTRHTAEDLLPFPATGRTHRRNRAGALTVAASNLGGLAKQYPGLRFTYMTVHRAKGLEADYAVVLVHPYPNFQQV